VRYRVIAISILLLASAAAQAAGNFCGPINNAYGPFDYRKRFELPANLEIVERVHFSEETENGLKGAGTGSWGGDLDYTLRAWPNHTRALLAMSRLAAREKEVQLTGAKYPVDCYFDRALRFAPDDAAVHAVYANHLFSQGQVERSLVEFKEAVALDPENPTINYNAGLAFLRAKNYDKALYHAQKAYAKNFPLPGLKNKLVEAGKWVDAPPAPKEDKPAAEDPLPKELKPAE
jgi:hypothetical protein